MNSKRLTRFTVSCFLLGLIGLGIVGTAASANKAPVWWCICLYLGFLFFQGVLLALLTSILVSEHGMRKWRIGIAGMLILTTMIALLFGVGSVLAEMLEPETHNQNEPVRAGKQFVGTLYGLLLFTIIPLIFFLEAVASWTSMSFRPKRGSRT